MQENCQKMTIFFHPNIFSDFPRWPTKKLEKRNCLHYPGVFEVEKNVFVNENLFIFQFSKIADQKTWKYKLSTLPGGFRGWEKRIHEWKFSFFTPAYFPIFQDGGPKNLKKGTFYITCELWGCETRFHE